MATVVSVAIALGGYAIYSSPTLLDRSFVKPLSESEIDALADKDARFKSVYNDISGIRVELLRHSSEETIAKYSEISYARLCKYLETYRSASYHNTIEREAAEKHKAEMVEPIMPQKAALIDKWWQFVEENDVNKHLTIDIETSYAEFIWRYPAYRFRMSMPKGTLGDATIMLYITDDSDEITRTASFDLQHTKKFSEEYNQLPDEVGNLDYWRWHHPEITIKSVTLVDGRELQADLLNDVPEEVMSYLDNPTERNECLMIQHLIDPSYVSATEHVQLRLEEALERLDPLCYALMGVIERLYYVSTMPAESEPW